MHIYVFACFFFFALVSADNTDHRETLKKVHEKCQSDPATHIDDATFEKLRQGETATDPNLAKHVLCMHVGEGLQSQNGDIIVDKLKEIVSRGPSQSQEKIDEIISKCATKTSDNAEEAAIGLSKCLRQFRPDHAHGHHHHN